MAIIIKKTNEALVIEIDLGKLVAVHCSDESTPLADNSEDEENATRGMDIEKITAREYIEKHLGSPLPQKVKLNRDSKHFESDKAAMQAAKKEGLYFWKPDIQTWILKRS